MLEDLDDVDDGDVGDGDDGDDDVDPDSHPTPGLLKSRSKGSPC